MRSFLAIAVPEEAAAAIGRLQGQLRLGHPLPPENLHLTLAFLGDQSEPALEELHFCLERLSAPGFDVEFGPLGSFGHPAPSSVHAEVRLTPELATLHRAVRGALHSAGLQTERRRFRPHITIARLPHRMTGDETAALLRFLATFAAAPLPSFPARALTLFRSHLRPEGAIHEPLTDYPLG